MKRFFVALLLVLPVLADAQHRVARIQVNSAVPARILLTQSTLVEGRSYTDADLEVAVARLRRLPFVYDARYRLDGETLILDVEAMSRFFGELDASGIGFENRQSGLAALGGGGRLFLGSGGVGELIARQHVSSGNDGQSLVANYSQYGIGGSRLFATVGIQQNITQEDDVDLDPQLRLTVGYPLTLRSTLTANLRTAGFESRRRVPILPRTMVNTAEQQLVNLLWNWDTTDDPYFARRGLLVSAGPEYTRDESSFDSLVVTAPNGEVFVLSSQREATTTELAAKATAFWPYRQRGAFFGIIDAAYRETDVETVTNGTFPLPGDVQTDDVAVAVGYAHNLFDWNSSLGTTRQRLELAVGTARSTFEQDDEFLFNSGTLDTVTASAAYVLRRQFATVRLNLSYTFD